MTITICPSREKIKSKKTNKVNNNPSHEVIIYESGDGKPFISVRVGSETVWLTQANISEHIKHIFEEKELDKNSVVRKFRTTAPDGKY